MLLQGVGEGVLFAPLLNQNLGRIRPAIAGAAVGVLSTGQQVGSALGVALLGVVFFPRLHTAVGAGPSYAVAFRASPLGGCWELPSAASRSRCRRWWRR